MMHTRRYTLRFLTPAFLGDAEQKACWRTPPIKHLLREWWRVAYAAEHRFAVQLDEMRHEEGVLFGHAWLDDDQNQRGQKVAARKSQVRLRLDQWDVGRQQKSQWPKDMTVVHPEVKDKRTAKPRPIGSLLYLGYGPLEFSGGTTLKKNAAIQAGESATFAIAFPITHKSPGLKALAEANAPRLECALWLMERFGTLGGRSRNGWGSFALTPLPSAEGAGERDTPPLAGALPLRPWRDCLDRDWPHAIGRDEKGPLIWQTIPHDDWQSLMKTLAVIKIGLRTQFIFPNAKPDGQVHERHWLSYPVTTHKVNEWNKNGLRLPNQLRFKIRQLGGGKLVGAIFHIPHLPPPAFCPNAAAIERTWEQVHALLDHLVASSPRTYSMIPEAAPARRRSALKPHLDTVALRRIAE